MSSQVKRDDHGQTAAPSELTGIAVREVRDGKLAHDWVERSAYELAQRLAQPAR